MISYLQNAKKRRKLNLELDNVVAQGEAIINKFSSYKNLDVKFDELVKGLVIGQVTEISEGVTIVLRAIEKDIFIIDCEMVAFSMLKIHHHSDFDEKFDVIEGEMHDLTGRKVYYSGESVTFFSGVSHTPYAKVTTKLKITGTRNK